MKMKKFLALLLTAAMALSLAGLRREGEAAFRGRRRG